MRHQTTATSFFLLLLVTAGLVHAAPVGQVINLSGPLFAIASDGTRRILSIGSQFEPGETLITEDKTYAQVRLVDKGVVTLRPDSQFKIGAFDFEEMQPNRDSATFGLLKGALRAITGFVGKRGNQDAYRMNAATATIGIRGTSFSATLCPSPACDSSLPPGTYVEVFEGQVALSSTASGSGQGTLVTPLILSVGQFGYVPPEGVPQQLPVDPGVGQYFTPPASFAATQQLGQQGSVGNLPLDTLTRGQAETQEGCIVR